ncbi:HNH endonuclease family protein [Streptomyces fuscigenes]|uniref:HNH endonuclease family protein n=1 Tax=Streptomyces fuscigenes TaxID=1528880 RepID=UPI001F46B95B|nr:HNH endonuclease family protein [Streptomyces fuscigenes]MCF3963351.1 HNH endonuclease family protein [Streptomyces fuscigenes]
MTSRRIGRATRSTGAVALLAGTLLLAGCRTELDPGGASSPGDDPSAASGAAAPGGSDRGGDFGVSPLGNPDGTKRGLAPLTSTADRKSGLALIDKVATKGRGPKTGYDRDEFGYAWMDSASGVPDAHNGCDTRDDVLKRDGEDVKYRSGSDCVLSSMTLHDPYTAKTIDWRKTKATAVQIDHVMPLSYDWQMGAAHWTKDERERIANDPLNLIPVDGSMNESKGDSGPAAWLPPNKAIRCSYAVRFAQVSLKYHLPVTSADKDAMARQCGG